MPKFCESCRYYSDDNLATTCPACKSVLRFTMLPPTGEWTSPPAESRPAKSRGGFSLGLGNLFENLIGSPIGLVVLLVLGLAATWAIQDWVMRDGGPGTDMSSRVKVGMHFSEVGRALDIDSSPTPSYPRMRDYFPADEFGDGRLDYEGHGVKLKVTFIGGYVTSVEESPSKAGPGFHGYKFVIYQR